MRAWSSAIGLTLSGVLAVMIHLGLNACTAQVRPDILHSPSIADRGEPTVITHTHTHTHTLP
eukprot:3342604-Heterocapsa_arctica.AAC.1